MRRLFAASLLRCVREWDREGREETDADSQRDLQALGAAPGLVIRREPRSKSLSVRFMAASRVFTAKLYGTGESR